MLDHRVEADVVAHPSLVYAALNVVPQHLARRVRGNRPAKMLIKAVIGELQAFLGAVGPQVAVHAAVHRLAMLVEASAPGVVPHTAPIGLFFEAHDFGHGRAWAWADWKARSCARPDGPAPMIATRRVIVIPEQLNAEKKCKGSPTQTAKDRGVVKFRRYGAGGGTGRLRIWVSRMLTGGIDNTWYRFESGERVMGAGPYPSAQGAKWGLKGGRYV